MTDHDTGGAFSSGMGQISTAFAERVRAAYRRAVVISPATQSPFWSSVVARSKPVHDALLAEDAGPLIELLSHPGRHYLFYGFDNLFKDDVESLRSSPEIRMGRVAQLVHMLSVLAEAVGANRVINIEFGLDNSIWASNARGMGPLLAATEAIVGQLHFPNPFPDEHGLVTPAGIISHRAIHAVYQSWRAAILAARFGPRIVEIGAGLGRSAFFARQFGLADYVLVDLPMTNVAQAVFLGLALGEDQVALTGEMLRPGQIGVFSPAYLFEGNPSFDLAVNADSLTEMTVADSSRYMACIAANGAGLLSINHEANEKAVGMLAAGVLRREYRSPYWLRPGYVEELFVSR